MKLCIAKAALDVKTNKDILVYNGQREGDTKWKGWSWKLLRTRLFINLVKLISQLFVLVSYYYNGKLIILVCFVADANTFFLVYKV